MIKKYKNKPTVVEVLQWNGHNTNEVQSFLQGVWKDAEQSRGGGSGKVLNRKIRIQTLEGCIWASEGDYIIKGTHDEYWAVKPHIFKEKYDEVIDTSLKFCNTCGREWMTGKECPNCFYGGLDA